MRATRAAGYGRSPSVGVRQKPAKAPRRVAALALLTPLALAGCFDIGHRIVAVRANPYATPPVPAHLVIDHGVRLSAQAAERLADGEPDGAAPPEAWCPAPGASADYGDIGITAFEYLADLATQHTERVAPVPGPAVAGARCFYRTRVTLEALARLESGPLRWMLRATPLTDGGWRVSVGERGCVPPECGKATGVAAFAAAAFSVDRCPTGSERCVHLGVPGLGPSARGGSGEARELEHDLVAEVLASLAGDVQAGGLTGVRWQGGASGDVRAAVQWDTTPAAPIRDGGPAAVFEVLPPVPPPDGEETVVAAPSTTPGGTQPPAGRPPASSTPGRTPQQPAMAEGPSGDDCNPHGPKDEAVYAEMTRGQWQDSATQAHFPEWAERWSRIPASRRADLRNLLGPGFSWSYAPLWLAAHCLGPQRAESGASWRERFAEMDGWERGQVIIHQKSWDPPDAFGARIAVEMSPEEREARGRRGIDRAWFDWRSDSCAPHTCPPDIAAIARVTHDIAQAVGNLRERVILEGRAVGGVDPAMLYPKAVYDRAGNVWVVMCTRTETDVQRLDCGASARVGRPIPAMSHTLTAMLAATRHLHGTREPSSRYGVATYARIGDPVGPERWRVTDGAVRARLCALWDGRLPGSSWDRTDMSNADPTLVERRKRKESTAIRSAFSGRLAVPC